MCKLCRDRSQSACAVNKVLCLVLVCVCTTQLAPSGIRGSWHELSCAPCKGADALIERETRLFQPLASCCAGSYWVPWVAHMISIVSVVYSIDCTTGAISTGRCSGAAAERQEAATPVFTSSLAKGAGICGRHCQSHVSGVDMALVTKRVFAAGRGRGSAPGGGSGCSAEPIFSFRAAAQREPRWARQADAAAGLPSSRRGQ